MKNLKPKANVFTDEFDNYMQQDAHEFLNFLINHINEVILSERPQANNNSKSKLGSAQDTGGGDSNSSSSGFEEPTWVHEIFQGILTSETKCLNCETVSRTSHEKNIL